MMNTVATSRPVRSFPPNYQWRSTPYAAKYFGRTIRRIQQWCTTGRFAALSIPTYQDCSNRWWILLMDDDPPPPPV